MNKYWEYHIKQYETMYRSTYHLIKFVEKKLPKNANLSILDVGCGGGANIYWLRKYFPNWRFVGIDIDKDALKVAKERNPGVEFIEMNVLNINNDNIMSEYDYIFAIQLISFVPFDIEDFFAKLSPLAKKGFIITGLFSEGWIEQHTIAIDIKNNWKGIYKIYLIERLKDILNKTFSRDFILDIERFEIDIDLPKPKEPKFGTYTLRTFEGKRLQISGFMLMPWYFVLIERSE